MAKTGVLKLYFHGRDADAARSFLMAAGLSASIRGTNGAAAGQGDLSIVEELCARLPGLGLRGSLTLPDERTDFDSLPGGSALATFRGLRGELARLESFSPLWDADAPFLYDILPDGSVQIAAWTRWDEQAEVPEAIDGLPVTAIGPGAFLGRGTLRQLVLPASLTRVAADAFDECPDLTLFTPDPALREALVRRGLDARPTDKAVRFLIEDGADGPVLVGVEGEAANLALPQGIAALGVGALRGRDALRRLTLPKGLKRVERDACFGCARLRELTLPEGVEALGESAFQGCASLERLTLSPALTRIPARAFYRCEALTEVEIPAGVTAIGESAFRGCASLRRVVLPEGLRRIAPGAFADCPLLSDMPIPATVEKLSADALPRALTAGGMLYLPAQGMLVRAEVKRAFALPEGARSLADRALEGCLDLLELTLPEGLERLGDFALSGCEGLKALTLPESATQLGRGTSLNCRRLRSVALPALLRAIPDECFRGCHSLEAIALPGGIAEVGNRAFEDCRALRALAIPEGTIRVGEHAFYRCEGLEALSLPATLKTLGAGALSGCKSLREITLNGRYRDCWRGVLEEARRAAIIAPLNAPEDFPGLWRKRVCLGYAAAKVRGIGYDRGAEAAVLAWMRAHGSSFLTEAAADIRLMRLLADNDCLSLRDTQALLDRAVGEARAEYVTTLLHYRHRRFGAEADGGGEELW